MDINSAINPPRNFPASWASAWGEDSYGYWQAFEIKGVQQIMRWIPEGKFKMGSPKGEAQRSQNEKLHDVIIETGFWLADTACTQELWKVIMGNNPSNYNLNNNEQNPIGSISWDNCQDFIQKANQLLGDEFLRLPRETEWEYACRAGTSTPFNSGETINTKQANFNGRHPYVTKKATEEEGRYSSGGAVPTVYFDPNNWGLFQMHGNVWEWCEDVYQADYSIVEASGDSARVLRGGSWVNNAHALRSANRNESRPSVFRESLGLRLAGGLDPQAT